MFVLMALFHYRCLPEHRETELKYPVDFQVDYVRVWQRKDRLIISPDIHSLFTKCLQIEPKSRSRI